jgi:hypothetical protein
MAAPTCWQDRKHLFEKDKDIESYMKYNQLKQKLKKRKVDNLLEDTSEVL